MFTRLREEAEGVLLPVPPALAGQTTGAHRNQRLADIVRIVELLLAKFLLAGQGDSRAEVTVSVFPGDVGGLRANVNRWRRQLGLSEVGEAELPRLVSSLDVDGSKAMLVDMSGQDAKTGKKARLIGVILPRGGETWFYKLMGDETVAAEQKAAFIKFVQTAEHPNAA